MADESKKPQLGAASSNEEPAIRATSGWTPSKIDTARRQADSGNLTLAADLWERVMGDERAIGPLQALCGIPGLPLTFETALSDLSEEQADPRIEAIESDFWDVLPDEILSETIRWCSGLGVALLHVSEWTEGDGGRAVPVCDVWHPRNLKWDDTDRTWKVRTAANQNWIPITPGDGEWVLITPYGRKRPWAKAPWYGLGLLWLAAQYAKLDWSDYNDVHGKPYKVAENTNPEKAGLVDDSEIQALTNKIAALARGGAITMPDGYQFRLVEATAGGWQTFLKLVDEVWPKAVSIALTGQNLATQVEGGSFAAAEVHGSVSHDRIRTFAEALSVGTRWQLWDWWCEFNFGDRQTPWARWNTQPPSDEVAEAQRLSTVAMAIQALTTANVPLDMVAMAERYGLPVDRERAQEQPPAQLFQYHLTFGIVTINEVRERLGLAPIPGGDKPPEPTFDPGGGGDPGGLSGLSARTDFNPVALSERAEADLVQGLGIGGMNKAGAPLQDELTELVALVERSESKEDIYQALTERYGSTDSPPDFVERLERTLTLAAMMGRLASVREV